MQLNLMFFVLQVFNDLFSSFSCVKMSNYLAVLTLDPLLRLFQYQGRCFAVFYQFFHLCVKLLAVTCKEVKNDVNLVNIVFWVHLFKRFPHLSIFLLFLIFTCQNDQALETRIDLR